jgi:hypothetical protein
MMSEYVGRYRDDIYFFVIAAAMIATTSAIQDTHKLADIPHRLVSRLLACIGSF